MSKRIIPRVSTVHQDHLGHLPPLLRRVYAARNIASPEELSKDLQHLWPVSLLSGVDQAAARLVEALEKQQSILVIGDFDTDGATGTALAVSALRALGAEQVSYLVPNRFEYGYGLTPEIVQVAHQQKPDLLITVDSGIASYAGVECAHALGMQVIITDHHIPGEQLPSADAIVNPNQPGDTFPSKCLAGVGVIFYLMLALRAHLKNIQWFEKRSLACPNMAQFLDLVALGTVADVVPLDKNNRILVHQGLQRIRAGKARMGMHALLQIAGRRFERLRATDLGFSIGPRLNAAGRLDDMSIGVACLLAEDEARALALAVRLDELNKERRVVEKKMQEEAFSAVQALHLDQRLPVGVCLYQEAWHQGVVGLVAARVKEKIHRPVIAFAKADETMLKGSARSVPGLHICTVLNAIAIKYPHLIGKFGGHAMAAGLSLPIHYFSEFSQAFAEQVGIHLTEEDLQPHLVSDGALSSEELNLETARLLYDASPWGEGFPEPLFDGEFDLLDQRIVGQRHLKLTLQVPEKNYPIDGIAFNVDLAQWPNFHCQRAHLAYRLSINEYQGRCKLQLLIEDIQIRS
ncbi:MAG: single-stranded-DNA-specific exonuclease RecJ [Coxiella sp. RIFCSPHIGHO2_12_FULL_44_14]|nr:MAG: single-stranded-DNA-specific exonuclease RecJ [Coxiella sp. RIFCSPHIGHO2_12_FULL_44_14]